MVSELHISAAKVNRPLILSWPPGAVTFRVVLTLAAFQYRAGDALTFRVEFAPA
jgi:hypothetical protein